MYDEKATTAVMSLKDKDQNGQIRAPLAFTQALSIISSENEIDEQGKTKLPFHYSFFLQ